MNNSTDHARVNALAADELRYPDRREVNELWDRCSSVAFDDGVCEWARGRGLKSLLAKRRDIVRVLPEGELPQWAEHWRRGGYRLLVPLYDAAGEMRSLMARRVAPGDGPKSLPPSSRHLDGVSLRVKGLGFVSPAAMAGIRGEGLLSCIIVEGEPDYLTWAARSMPVIGIRSGTWGEGWAAHFHEGAEVPIRTHRDAAGYAYAAKVGRSLPGANLYRLTGDDDGDDNARLMRGDLALDPRAGCTSYEPPAQVEHRAHSGDRVDPGSVPDRERQYAEAALRGEVDRVASAPAGGVNDALNRSSFAAGRLCKGSGAPLDEGTVYNTLYEAARARGQSPAECKSTINSGMRNANSWSGLPADDSPRYQTRQRQPMPNKNPAPPKKPRSLARDREPEAKERREKWEDRTARLQARDSLPNNRPEAPRPDKSSEGWGDGRPVITIVADRIAPLVDGLEQAVIEAGGIYQRAGMLVHVVVAPAPNRAKVKRACGSPMIAAVHPARMREVAAEVAAWEKFDGRSGKYIRRLPPIDIIAAFMARGQWGVPAIVGVASAPQLRADGTIVTTPGLDAETGICIDLDPDDWPDVPERPAHHEAVKALLDLAKTIADFPFAADHDTSATLAAILTACVRGAIDGPTPLFAIRAPVAGTGKSLLAAVVAIIATGREPALMSPAMTDEEDRKRLLSLALAGDPVIVLDNIERPLGSAALAAALTSSFIRDRILGESRLVSAPWRAVTMATGNNLILKGDLARRVVPIDLDPRCESPEERSGWEHPDLRRYLAENRPRLYIAALTAVRAYIRAGTPDQGQSPMGSFESWSDLIRGTILWAGLPDPCAGRAKLRHDSDTGRATLAAALAAWHACHDDEAQTLADVLSGIDANDPTRETAVDLKDALESIAGSRDGSVTVKSLGYALRARRDRVVDGLRFESAGVSRRKRTMWRVVRSA